MSESTEQSASGATTPESVLSGSSSSINDNNNSNNNPATTAPVSSSSSNSTDSVASSSSADVTTTTSASVPIASSSTPSTLVSPSASLTSSSVNSLSSSVSSTASSTSNSSENQKETPAASSSGKATSGSSNASSSSTTTSTGTTTTAATSSNTTVTSAPSMTATGSSSTGVHNGPSGDRSSGSSSASSVPAGDVIYSANNPHTIHVLNGSQVSNGYDLSAQNGHLAMNGDGIPNGVIMDATALAGATFIPQGIQHYHRHGITMAHGPAPPMAAAGGAPVNNRVSPPGASGTGLYRPMSNHRGHSPHRYSPNTPHSRGNSPHNQSSNAAGGPGASQRQHVVHVVVNPGETFTVCIGDQTQHIPGPAQVRMVSNNGCPPLPMPMQVPPGHQVQQLVDEHGTLTHMILSPQHPGMSAPPMTQGGPNNTPAQMYSPYPGYTPYTGMQYVPHHHPHPAGPPPPAPPHHMHPHGGMGPPPHLHSTPPPVPHQCNSHPHIHPQGPPPGQHHNHVPVDERAHRQKMRLREKIHQRHKDQYYPINHIPTSPRRTKPKVNGSIDMRSNVPTTGRGPDANSSSSSADGQEIEEERRAIRELLSKMQLPKVSEVESRSALIQLIPPECNQQEFDIDPSEFKYELLLSDKGRDGKYKLVYNGDATEITLKDLKPATEYHLRVSSILDDLKGDLTEQVSFRTEGCEPDPPPVPKLTTRTKTSLLLKWNATADNGAKITAYTLECDQGRGEMKEIYSGLQRQFKLVKLSASTGYAVRLAAINSVGKSAYSEAVCFYTSGSCPSQPDPPMLSEQFVKALTISWIKRPNDDEFTLQMEDEATGHGFLTVYNGPDLSYKIKNLRRNTEYRFRMSANNEEGSSKWSDAVCYKTLPDKPCAPPKPQIKGKVHSSSFRVVWDPPRDTGGSEIVKHLVEMDDGRGFELVYDGSERDCTCDHLLPGHLYRLRVACVSTGGQSEWCEPVNVTTQAVAPGPCHAPKLQGKPKATTLHLRWNYPDYDGGAQVTEFEVQMTNPDNTTREVFKGRDLDCTVAGLSPGRPYIFQVRAQNKAGTGSWSDSLEVVSGAGVPDPPKMPLLTVKSPHATQVTWEEPVNNGATITEYRLEWQQKADAEFAQVYYGPALNYEVRGLTAATSYSFRVQALNSAGAGPFSAIATCTTPPSCPNAVVLLKASTTANSVFITWKEPSNNGSDILSYNIDLGEKHLIAVGNELEYNIDDLLPETTYRIRVQAINAIGVGSFGTAMKVTTKSLPPNPPRLECIASTHNTIRLKWGDGKNPDLIQYVVEIMRDNGSFHPIYHGPSNSHKISRLSELTDYEFRIYASNEAGDGPYSEMYKFSTTKAPPPALKPPKVSNVSLDACTVEWNSIRPMGSDRIVYCLQLRNSHGADHEYRTVYRGSETSFHITELLHKTEYLVRVCAMRQCSDGIQDLTGAFSPGVAFRTLEPKPSASASSTSVVSSRITSPKQLSDQQWAMIILSGFAVFAVIIAFIAQEIITYVNSSSQNEHNGSAT